MSDVDDTATFYAICGLCWRETQSSPWPGVHWTDFGPEDGSHVRWQSLMCPIHGEIALRADKGSLDTGLVRQEVGETQANNFSLFTEEWAGIVEVFDVPTGDRRTLRLEAGQIEGGFVCGHCGAHTTFTGSMPSCSGCGR